MPAVAADHPETTRFVLSGPAHVRLRSELKAMFDPILRRYFRNAPPAAAVGILASDLSEVLPEVAGAGQPSLEPLYALMRGATARTDMLQAQGGCISSDEAAGLLGVSKTRVLERYKQGTVLGVRVEKQRAVKFPVWQFSDGAVREGVAETIGLFREVPELDDWAILTFFLSPRESLNGKAPVDLLQSGAGQRVANIARSDLA